MLGLVLWLGWLGGRIRGMARVRGECYGGSGATGLLLAHLKVTTRASLGLCLILSLSLSV